MAKIEFTRNYSDLSTDTGFQFEFDCDRCGTGFRTEFEAFGPGAVAGAGRVRKDVRPPRSE